MPPQSRPASGREKPSRQVYRSAVELLERDGALAALAEAHDDAARGDGRVVVVTGEPGIGKTALVARFVADLDDGARVLVGTCDDLSIPRPLGAIHDLAGSVVAGARRGALRPVRHRTRSTSCCCRSSHSAAADRARARGRALGGRRDAGRDHGARTADRRAPRAARPHVPRRRGAAGSPGARRVRRDAGRGTRSTSSSRRCRRARSPRSTGTDPATCSSRPEATRSTSPSCSPPAAPTSCRRRSRTRSAGASPG